MHGLLISSHISAQQKLHINWSVAAILPQQDSLEKQPGLAGAFAGIHNNVLLIAGGANFPDAMPWEGGKKIYWNDIYILIRKTTGKFAWYTKEKFKLKQRIAYGASVSTDDGIVCIGGENETGISGDVFLLRWNNESKKVVINSLPALPVPIANAAACANGKIIYLAGGETANAVSDRLYFLNLENISAGWKELPPIPKPVSHAVMVVQSNGVNKNIYLIGGRRKNENGISELYNSVFEFDILENKWMEKRSLPSALSAGTGIATGSNTILLFGGDNGEIFHKTEELITSINTEKDEIKKQILIQQKNKLQQSHPGFSKDVLIYDAIKNEWKKIGKIPFNTPATTGAVKWGNDVLIPSGEIKAGIRTPQILICRFKNK